MWKNIGITFAVFTVIVVLAHQEVSLRRLHSELATIPRGVEQPAAQLAEPSRRRNVESRPDPNLDLRLAELEKTVAELARASDYLMDRGQLPLATNKIEDLARKFLDAGSTDAERLQALRLLRRNRALTDEMATFAATWIPGITNSNLREDALEQLGGATNAILREPLMRLAMNDTDADVREQAVENLRRFVADPQVEAQLWQAMRNDPDPDVREQAQEALTEGAMTDARLATMRELIGNPQSSVDDVTLAGEAIGEAGKKTPEDANQLAQLAYKTQDPKQLLKLFDAFDDHNDPAFIAPLIHYLQDPNPIIREHAAEALRDYRSNPTASQWLDFLTNDPDPLVSRKGL